MIIAIITFAGLGLLVSLYGLYVERQLRKNSDYKAACDISDNVSCTRPMLSPYRNMFGISNSLVSALFYLSIIGVAFLENLYALKIMTGLGLIVTFFFAYILYFKIKSLCLICNVLYVINIVLFSICNFTLS